MSKTKIYGNKNKKWGQTTSPTKHSRLVKIKKTFRKGKANYLNKQHELLVL